MKIGFDLDGVVAIHTINRGRNPYKCYKTSANSGIDSLFPDDEVFLITARSQRFKKVTLEWLKNERIDYEQIHFFPIGVKKNDKDITKHKVKYIKKLGIKRFYDDNCTIAATIKTKIPGCRVFIVRKGKLLEVVKA